MKCTRCWATGKTSAARFANMPNVHAKQAALVRVINAWVEPMGEADA